MSADRAFFNRRAERQKLGTRSNRRANTKSGNVKRVFNHETKTTSVETVYRERPRARLNKALEEARREHEADS